LPGTTAVAGQLSLLGVSLAALADPAALALLSAAIAASVQASLGAPGASSGIGVAISSITDVATGGVIFAGVGSRRLQPAAAAGSQGVSVAYNVLLPAGVSSAAAVQAAILPGTAASAAFAATVTSTVAAAAAAAAATSPSLAAGFASVTAAVTTASPAASPASLVAPPSSLSGSSSPSPPAGFVIGGVVGGFALLVALCCCCLRVAKRSGKVAPAALPRNGPELTVHVARARADPAPQAHDRRLFRLSERPLSPAPMPERLLRVEHVGEAVQAAGAGAGTLELAPQRPPQSRKVAPLPPPVK